MPIKSISLKVEDEPFFYSDLNEIVSKKRIELLRETNIALASLFGKIGNILKQSRICDDPSGSNLKFISSWLEAIYGPCFAENNLKKMGKVADHFDDLQFIELIAAVLSWEHIFVLSHVFSWDAKFYYIKLTLAQSLSAKGLLIHLKKDLSKSKTIQVKLAKKNHCDGAGFNYELFKKRISTLLEKEHNQQLCHRGILNNSCLKNFKKEVLLTQRLPKLQGFDKEIYVAISEFVDDFTFLQKRRCFFWDNSRCWEIGALIYKKIAMCKNHKQLCRAYIRKISLTLNENFNINFGESHLEEMVWFAEIVPDRKTAFTISSLVSWAHILVLLSLHETKDMVYYAEIAALENLSIIELRKKVNDDKDKTRSSFGRRRIRQTEDLVEDEIGNNKVNIKIIHRHIEATGEISI